MSNKAYNEYNRIKNLSAFTVQGATRRNVNQHMRKYVFKDGSELEIYKSGKAVVPHLVVGAIRCNAFGQ